MPNLENLKKRAKLILWWHREPSKAFHAMVKYSSLRPWRTIAVRSKMAVSAMSRVYNAPSQSRTKICRRLKITQVWAWPSIRLRTEWSIKS
jgi:hypothetical protein